jgi:hypothetical protein
MQVLFECLLHRNEKFTWENWYHLFCHKVSFSTSPHIQFLGHRWMYEADLANISVVSFISSSMG